MKATIETTIAALQSHGLPDPVAELRFAPPRRFRWDWSWPDYLVAVEIQGGRWQGGRHTRPAGYRTDCEKLALGQLLGWKVIWCVPEQIASGELLTWLLRALGVEL